MAEVNPVSSTPNQRGSLRISSKIAEAGRAFRRGLGATVSTTTDTISRTREKIASRQKAIDAENKKQAEIDKKVKETVKRKSKENDIEADAIVRPVKSLVTNVITKPLKSFWNLLAAWGVANLPAIIKQIKIFVKKVRVVAASIKKAFGAIGPFFKSLLGITTALIQNLKEFDFTDKSGRLEAAKLEMDSGMEEIRLSVEEVGNVWGREEAELDKMLLEFEEGKTMKETLSALLPPEVSPDIQGETGQNGEVMPTTPALGSQPSAQPGAAIGVTGTEEEYRIAAAIATESGRGLSATDVLQVAANRVSSPSYPNTFTDVFAQPKQFEGVFKRGLTKYRDIKTAEDAAAFVGGNTTVATINQYLTDIKNIKNREDSAKFVGGALEFRAAPGYYQARPTERPAGTGNDGRIPMSSWRGGSGDNQILKNPSQDPMLAAPAPINLEVMQPGKSGGSMADVATPKPGSAEPRTEMTMMDRTKTIVAESLGLGSQVDSAAQSAVSIEGSEETVKEMTEKNVESGTGNTYIDGLIRTVIPGFGKPVEPAYTPGEALPQPDTGVRNNQSVYESIDNWADQYLKNIRELKTTMTSEPVGSIEPTTASNSQRGTSQYVLANKVPFSDFSRTSTEGGGGTVGKTSDYGMRGGRMHYGVDIGTSQQKGFGFSLKLKGRVITIENSAGGGHGVEIQSGNLIFRCLHLASKPFVRKGPYNGEVIGEIGNTGRSTGEHLHLEVYVNGSPVDPNPYVRYLEIGKIKTVSKNTTPITPTASTKAEQTSRQVASIRTNWGSGSAPGSEKVLIIKETDILQVA